MTIIEAFPLQWPAGYTRTKFPKSSQFKATFGSARDGILHELKLLGATHPVISSNVPLRRDGIPYAGQAEPKDPGVAVYFMLKGKQMVLACDRWKKVAENLRAIEKAVEAMRGLDRWGVSDMLNRAFTGFTALPPPSTQPTKRPWWEVLDHDRDAPLSSIEATYREYAKMAHPDIPGAGTWSGLTMAELNQAIAEARAEKRRSA